MNHSYVEYNELFQEVLYNNQGTKFHNFINDYDHIIRTAEHTFIHPNVKDLSTTDFSSVAKNC